MKTRAGPNFDWTERSRRTALKAFGTAEAAVARTRAARVHANRGDERAAGAANLSTPQLRTLETLVEAIIPADDRSPGAKQARVAEYIDLWLSESDRHVVLEWTGGLASLDAEAAARFRAPFVRLTAAQLDAILADISRNERDPKTPLETFFVMAKQATVIGYYTSKIGIHDELHYKGNVFLREFVGCQTEDGKDCPHCGQKHI
jgi:hypothetical protein